jgi:hypothetical protein
MDKRQIRGYVMAVVGFAMLLFNALGYIMDWDTKSAAFIILGLVFVLIGLKTARAPLP